MARSSRLFLAEYTLGDALLTTLSIFFFVIWIWILSDLFRDHEVSGWMKAVWVLFLVFIPFLTALIYLIAARGCATARGPFYSRCERITDMRSAIAAATSGLRRIATASRMLIGLSRSWKRG